MPLSAETPGTRNRCSHFATIRSIPHSGINCCRKSLLNMESGLNTVRYHQQRLEDDSIGRWGGSRAVWDPDCSLRQRDRAEHVEVQRCNFAARRQRVVAVEIRSRDGWSAHVSRRARLRLGIVGEKPAERPRAKDAYRSRSVESHCESRSHASFLPLWTSKPVVMIARL